MPTPIPTLPLLLVSLLLTCTLCDCPLSQYPSRTTTTIIRAQINNDQNLHNKQLQYTSPVPDDFVMAQVKFAISIVSFQVMVKDYVEFKVEPKTSVGIEPFKFYVFVGDRGWRVVNFGVFATQSELFEAQVLTTSDFSGGVNTNRYAIYRSTPRYSDFQAEPAIRIYLAGYTLRSRPATPEQTIMQATLQFRKKLQPNSALVTSLTQSLQLKRSLSLTIVQSKLLGRFYTLALQTQAQLTSLTYSIILYSKAILRNKYNIISSSFTIVNDNQYKFTGLSNMDMVFAGLTSARMPREENYGFQLKSNNLGGQFSYKTVSNFNHFDTSYIYFAIQTKNAYVCDTCVGGSIIYNDRFCVGQCPRGYSVAVVSGIKICDKCDIEKLKVNDPQTGLCVCAKRHYFDKASDSCKPCRYDCLTCDGPDRCLTCDNALQQTKRKLGANAKCQCPAVGFYDDKSAQNIVCQKCDSRCRTCNGPRAFDCLTCQSNRQLDPNRFCICKNGFTQDQSNNCICPPPRTLSQSNICLDNTTSCQQNKQLKTINGQNKCICKPGFIPILDNCIKCGPNSVFNKSNLKCQCIKQTIQINENCIKCGVNQQYDSVYRVCVCSNGAYRKDDGSCVTCPNKMVLINDVCQCVYNYYEVSDGVCKPCTGERDGPKCKRNIS